MLAPVLLDSKCFICGIEKTKFDEAFQKRGIQKGFELEHIHHEHNMWDYLFFVMHLNHKDERDYTGAETFVASCIAEQDIGWVPTGRAMELIQKEEENDVVEAIADGTASISLKFDNLVSAALPSRRLLPFAVLEYSPAPPAA